MTDIALLKHVVEPTRVLHRLLHVVHLASVRVRRVVLVITLVHALLLRIVRLVRILLLGVVRLINTLLLTMARLVNTLLQIVMLVVFGLVHALLLVFIGLVHALLLIISLVHIVLLILVGVTHALLLLVDESVLVVLVFLQLAFGAEQLADQELHLILEGVLALVSVVFCHHLVHLGLIQLGLYVAQFGQHLLLLGDQLLVVVLGGRQFLLGLLETLHHLAVLCLVVLDVLDHVFRIMGEVLRVDRLSLGWLSALVVDALVVGVGLRNGGIRGRVVRVLPIHDSDLVRVQLGQEGVPVVILVVVR